MTEQSPAEAIFFAALEKAAGEERNAYLDAACGADSNLRQRVERLLAAHPQVGSFLQEPAQGGVGAAEAPTTPPGEKSPAGQGQAETTTYRGPGEGVGSIIAGRYKLLQQIGEGGMGVVYMAEQQEPVRRKVALKIIKPGMDSHQVIARFEAERQALAMMDHQNIARVLDAGTTDSARPYFVMELVHGVPITQFCDDNQLTPRERLLLFVPVCHAIQHAHQKGIIHRDVKPSNVLVTMYDDKPVPKVIDFGVAKAIEQRLTEKTLFTQFGTLVGTFEYMSPEQAEMNAFGVDTRSDVYSLGVLLYELLTGTTPLERKRLKEVALYEVVRLIREEEPPRPSARLSSSGNLPKIAAQRKTEPGRLALLVRGELDWIVMRCLEKDRVRRYETTSALARDVEHYLHDEPVEACPPSVGYRLRKIARKNRGILTAAAAFLALLIAGAAISGWLAVQAMRAEGYADKKREEAEEAGNQATQERNRAQLESERAKRNAAETQRALDRMTVAKGLQLAENGNLFAALPWFIKPLEHGGLTPEEEKIYRTRIACYLRYTPNRPTLRHLLFHDAKVTQSAFSSDAKQVLTVSDKNVHVWDVRSGKAIAKLKHPGTVTAAQFTPDSTRVLATVGPGVWKWNVRSGMAQGAPFVDWGAFVQYMPSLLPQTPLAFSADFVAWDSVNSRWQDSRDSVEISHDGRRVLVSFSGILRLLDLQTGKLIRQWALDDSRRSPMDHALSPDGQRLLLVRDGVAKAFDTTAGKTEGRLIEHGSAVVSVAFSPDGTHAVTLGKQDRRAQIWDSTNWKAVGHVADLAPDRYVALSPDNRSIVASGADRPGAMKSIFWRDVASGRLICEAGNHDHYVKSYDWRPDGQQLVIGSDWGDVTIWHADAGKTAALVLPHGSSVSVTAYAPDGRMLLTASDEGVARIWDLSGREEWVAPKSRDQDRFSTTIWEHRNDKGFKVGVMSMEWSWATVAGTQKRVWPDRAPIERALPNSTAFDFGALSPDRCRVITEHDTSLQLWDATTGRRLGKPLQIEGLSIIGYTFACFSPDSCNVVVADSSNRIARLVNANTGEPVGDLLEHDGPVVYAAFSPDGALLVTCSEDRTARLWWTKTGKPAGEKLRHGGIVTTAAFSPSGQMLATGCLDGTVHIWDVGRKVQVGIQILHHDFARELQFHPNGLYLLAVVSTNMLKIWDVVSLQEVAPSVAGSQILTKLSSGLSFEGDGRVVIGFRWGRVKPYVYDLKPDTRPARDLIKLAQLYSGRSWDAQGGAIPLGRHELESLLRELKDKYPEEFVVSPKAAVEWRTEQSIDWSAGRRWLAADLAESDWQPGARNNEDLALDDYFERLFALALYGRHAEAVAAAEAYTERWAKDAGRLYSSACVHALAAGAVKGDAPLSERYAVRAVALLRQAVDAGYKDSETLRKDPDLNALRGRDDFKKLVKEREK